MVQPAGGKLSESSKAEHYRFTPIAQLEPAPETNFYGRVIYYKEPRPTRADMAMSLVVVDDSIAGTEVDDDGLSVCVFRPSVEEFPRVTAIGDIVQFRHMKIQTYEGSLQAVSTKYSRWTTFHQEGNGRWTAFPEHELSEFEQSVIKRLTTPAAKTPQSPSRQRREVLKVSQLYAGLFFDLRCRVIKVFPQTREDQALLVVSDFTENRQVVSDVESLELEPHYRHAALPVTCWDQNASTAAALAVGQDVLLTNLHARAVDGHLVASLHGDARCKIVPLSSDEDRIPLDKACANLRAQKRRESDLQVAPACTTSTTSTGVPEHLARVGLCFPDGLATASIPEILASELPCFKYILKGRVIDYFPHETREFICEEGCFAFCLIVQDESQCSLPVVVAAEDAVTFLNGLHPINHAAYHEELRRAMQRLLTSPMESLFAIKAYTIADGERRYGLHGTRMQ